MAAILSQIASAWTSITSTLVWRRNILGYTSLNNLRMSVIDPALVARGEKYGQGHLRRATDSPQRFEFCAVVIGWKFNDPRHPESSRFHDRRY